MKFGWRIVKTGIAVCLCVLIAHLLHLEYPFYSAIAAVIALQATLADSFKQGVNRLKGTLVGAAFGYLFALVAINNPLWIGLGVVVTFVVLNHMRWNEAMNIASIVFIAITLNIEGDPLNYAFNRLADTALGILIAFLVNWLVFPPKYKDEVENAFDKSRDQVIKIYRLAFRALLDSEKSVDKEAIQDLKESIKHSKKLVTLSRRVNLWGKVDETFRLVYVEPMNRLERMSFAVEQILALRKGWIRPFSAGLERDLTKLLSQSFYLLSLIMDPKALVAPSIYLETTVLMKLIHDSIETEQNYAGSNKGYLLELLHWVEEITKAASGCLRID
ncbi:aromatic acid exporter family protein [Desulfosporosinus sp. Sb-LF]|uniref:FUSC family protein n=1 Tax=Desulfosporosinus sp. Sb-LF TaxID=2560027 RepID=UPI00107F5085|nr:aromatic acid exporter family protein [Desulfosporosinus sp. Sb-LF]TGE33865.1 aromatic acid exporter family protein [Desulfosporosinus sp. Sb-LF]